MLLGLDFKTSSPFSEMASSEPQFVSCRSTEETSSRNRERPMFGLPNTSVRRFPLAGLFRRNTGSLKVFYKEVSGVFAMVANSVIEFRADPDAKFTRLYLHLLKAAFENGQSLESHDDLISHDDSVGHGNRIMHRSAIRTFALTKKDRPLKPLSK
jgi:hypothetical protein